MSKSILDQFYWIEQFKEKLGLDPLDQFNRRDEWIANPRQVVFFNPVNHRSMRLTRAGFKYLRQRLGVTEYSFELPEKITPKVLLQLERYIHYPYFILNLKKIMVFDERTAIMLQLHNNDLETYLDNLEQHQ